MPTAPHRKREVDRANNRFALVLLVVFLLIFVALGISPSYRADWLLENLIVFLGLPAIIALHRHVPLSRVSYSMIFVFLVVHEIGAHYTYAQVPYEAWLESLTGHDTNENEGWRRNYYDRIVHFLYGLLMTYPVREIVLRVSRARGFWAYLLPLLVVISTSTVFELLEWAVAIVFGGDLGIAYLATQGDVWDPQKDMALAALGGVIATSLTAGANSILDRDFAREWAESLMVKVPDPLGEREIARLLEEKQKSEELRGSHTPKG